MPATTYLRTEWMEYATTSTAPATQPTEWWVALHTDDPTAAGTANEVSGSSYARVDVTPDGEEFAGLVLTGLVASPEEAVVFPTVTGSAYTVTHVSLWDDAAAGNCLFYGALLLPKQVNVGEAAVFAPGELTFTVV